jgi:hypothetical protein
VADVDPGPRVGDEFNSISRDGTPENISQRQLKDLVNGSQRTRESDVLQKIAMSSRGAARSASFQAMADRYVLQKTGWQGRQEIPGSGIAQLARIDVPAQLQNVFAAQYIDTQQLTLAELEALYAKVTEMSEKPAGDTVAEREKYQALLESISVGLLDAIVAEDYKAEASVAAESGLVDEPSMMGESPPKSLGEDEKKAEPGVSGGSKAWAPTIGGYYWKHIFEGHALGSDKKGKSKWATDDKEILKAYVDAIFEANKGYIKPHHFRQNNRRLWGQLPSIVGVEGKTGAPTKGVIIWVQIERAYGRCKIISAYPGEY